jgi:hypothetical protein
LAFVSKLRLSLADVVMGGKSPSGGTPEQTLTTGCR